MEKKNIYQKLKDAIEAYSNGSTTQFITNTGIIKKCS